MRVLLAALCLLSLATAAHAVPVCVPGTMADDLALTTGCRIGNVTVADLRSFRVSGGNALDLVVTPAPGATPGALRLVPSLDQSITGADVMSTATADSPVIHRLAGRDHKRRFSELAAAISTLPSATLILDGEVALFDESLVSTFEWFRKRPEDVASTPPVYMAFDCLYLEGPRPADRSHCASGAQRAKP
jgi:hypothetical protein